MDPQSKSEASSGVDVQAADLAMPVLEGGSTNSAPFVGHQIIHWHSLGDAILFTLLIAGPTMLWEEVWRGQPMIDQKGHLWMVPTVIVTATYFVGGAIAGRHRRRPFGALVQGVALAVPTSLVLVIADLARRLVLRKDIPVGVAGLWLAAIGGTIVIAVLGAWFGRWLYIKRQARLSLTRHG
jgi:hypothetical protein